MSQNCELLVWAGVHGKEVKPGIPLVRSLQDDPIKGVRGEIAHPRAVSLGVRQIDINLAYCLRDPELFPGTEEASLAPEILHTSEKARMVLDIHQQGVNSADQDLIYIGPQVRRGMLGLIALTGITTVIVSKSGLQGRLPHAILADITPKSPRNNTDYWRNICAEAVAGNLTVPSLSRLELFAHDDLSAAERKELGLMGTEYAHMQEMPGTESIFGTAEPLRALYGWTADYEATIEVVTPIDRRDISQTDDIVHMPTLDRGVPRTMA